MAKRRRISERHAKKMAKIFFPVESYEGSDEPQVVCKEVRKDFLLLVEEINNYYSNLPSGKIFKIDPDQMQIPVS